jgi:hypothetical protein
MPVSVLTFVNWRSTLVAMQTTLQGTLTPAQGAEGYSLLAALNTAGATYDTAGDDSPRNTSSFSTLTCQPYMISAVPVFSEYDRLSRLAYATYVATATLTLAQAQAFGLYTTLSALPAGQSAPSALSLLWNTSPALWASLLTRGITAASMLTLLSMNGTPNLGLVALLAKALASTVPYQMPPVDPSPTAAVASSSATAAVNTAVTNGTTWISSLSFS